MLGKIGVRMVGDEVGAVEGHVVAVPRADRGGEGAEQALLDEFYEQFISVVAEGRKLPAEQVRALATGEIFTAVRGKETGLVDELGDLDSAIDLAAEMSQAPRRVRYVRPREACAPC